MNESSRISDKEVTDMLRWRSARPAPDGLASAILESLASERVRNPARTTGRSAKRPLMLLAAAALLLVGGALAAGAGALRLWSITPPEPAPSLGLVTTPVPDTTSGGMWPQSTLEEVRAAQERADAGDPDYTWQVGARVVEEDPAVELVDRFIREVLGWQSYKFHDGGTFGWNDTDNSVEGTVTGQRYLRCASGRTNPLYREESCAPTLDDLRYETVSFDLAQLDRQGRDGIWVVSGWRLTAPFAQADPVAAEAQARESLEAFLAARVAGSGAEWGAEWYVKVDGNGNVPLLYATTSGAPYERYEIERVGEPRWPDGWMTFSARLFADDDATVVEQGIVGLPSAGFRLDANSTTENGQPVVLSYTSADGEVTVSAPGPWSMWWPEMSEQLALDVWFGLMKRDSDESGTSIGFVDPVAYDAWCAANGGSPLLSAPADAAGIAQQVIADPNFETTAPLAARVGGLDAVLIDVAIARGGRGCRGGGIEISRWIHERRESGSRLRLYLVDLPAGMSVKTMAITIVAPEERFEEVIAETAPIIASIEFHPND
jgi:hypothetical protein